MLVRVPSSTYGYGCSAPMLVGGSMLPRGRSALRRGVVRSAQVGDLERRHAACRLEPQHLAVEGQFGLGCALDRLRLAEPVLLPFEQEVGVGQALRRQR